VIIRPLQPLFASEVDAVYNVIHASTRADWVHRVTHQSLRHVADPARSTAVVWLGEQPAGFSWWECKEDGLVFEGWVDPAHRRKGVGTALLVQIERFARENGLRELRCTTYSENVGAQALYKLREFQEARRFDQRWVALPNATFDTHLPLPTGITVEPYSEKWLTALVEAEHDAFSQHWGAHRTGITAQQVRNRIAEILNFDARDFWLACDGAKVAAFVLAQPSPLNGSPDDAWLWHVGTRYAYQRQGIARALLHRALARLQQQGYLRAGLHVDAENPSAVALYASAGMETVRQRIHYQKVL
jgi:mycothiol synthase